MICLKCKYYAPLVGRSYNLSKCLKLSMFTNPGRFTNSSTNPSTPAIEKCKGEYFEQNCSIRSKELIKK